MADGRMDGVDPRTRLPSVIFDVDRLDPRDRPDALAEFFAPAVEVLIAETAPEPAPARIEMWQLGKVLVVNGESPEVALRRSPRQVARDSLDHWTLRVVCSGELLSRTGDRVYRQRPGNVVLDSMVDEFSDHWTRSKWISFVVPRAGFESLEFVNRDEGPLQGPAIALFAEFAVSLVRHLKEADPDDAAALAEMTTAMIRTSFLRSPSRCEVSPTDLVHRQREAVRTFIRQNLASARLSPQRISEVLGLSRSALYRLFENHGGVSQYIQDRRFELVMQDLRDPETARSCISRVAEARGFHNASAFSRAFRQRFGCTPRDVRNATLRGAHFAEAASLKTGRFTQLLR